mmetsp:Transcript_59486/g.121861  ORF Transcript_59486/g.121861 Transcript_59486/m.121861 type:complete len:105 (-) Transcript_59486:291-605(-)|eukprot:CAMPEP_0181319078 /NCGR_PEP_ID=MMETSP1101-20121128/17368_1 /TAXON_ID=46948 /ORGANISM="Rhodomonas abbreviata, Strain Caron Lab Isolate" /LENGTH=104 /DNA_ID=CAMNT_0023426631 /DNA_START=210 /DNA_END=524 /DNA_ORIENTATION=+
MSEHPGLTLEQAQDAAREALAKFSAAENVERLNKAQAECAGDISKFFVLVIPVAVELIGDTIMRYGFEKSQMGALAFVNELQKHNANPEVALAERELKSKFMPT